MDQETANAIAELRGELSALRGALGMPSTAAAEIEVRNLRAEVSALIAWAKAQPTTPPFTKFVPPPLQ